jgi:PAS domain S-box-containing protein
VDDRHRSGERSRAGVCDFDDGAGKRDKGMKKGTVMTDTPTESVRKLRQGAEEKSRVNETIPSEVLTLEETKRLLHELRVHQIELETQNEELRRTQYELKVSRARYFDLYDLAPVGYLTLSAHGLIQEANLAAATMLGMVRGAMVKQPISRIIFKEDQDIYYLRRKQLIKTGEPQEFELRLVKNDGTAFWAHLSATAEQDPSTNSEQDADSAPVLRVVLSDITERKSAEKALQKLEVSAQEALRIVEEAAKEALRVVEEAEDAPLMVEKAADVARLKVEKSVVVARLQVEEAARELQDIYGAVNATIKLDLAAEIARIMVEKAAEAAHSKVEKTAAVLRSVKITTEVLRKEIEVADAATQAKSQFLANMSHELRTPMTGVLGMLDLVLLGNLEAEQREFINAAHTSALSLVRILNDILDMTKIEMGKFSIEAKPFSVRKCVESSFNILFPAARSKGLDLYFTVADDVPETLVGDQIRINQVLTNLIGNAVKFTKQGKVALSIEADGSESGGKLEVTFTVTDTGIGIPDDKKDLLFRVFSQVDESHSRSYGGAGLGLAICKELVELMGGTISFTSKEGKGSTFSCTIPFGVTEAERVATLVSSKTATSGDAPRTEETIIARLLVAEDDQTIRQVLGAMLRMSKYETDFAENGQLVVEMWENGNYDLILMDIQMPLMNGFEATATIREKERTRGGHIPIVAMTAHALKEDEERCLDAGMDAYISKPIDFMACLQLIEETLKNQAGLELS